MDKLHSSLSTNQVLLFETEAYRQLTSMLRALGQILNALKVSNKLSLDLTFFGDIEKFKARIFNPQLNKNTAKELANCSLELKTKL